MERNPRMLSRRTLALAILAAFFGVIAAASYSWLAVALAVLIMLALVAQVWLPRTGAWLMLALIITLAFFTLPTSLWFLWDTSKNLFLMPAADILRLYNRFNTIVITLAWILAGPLAASCAVALVTDIVRLRRVRS